MRGRIVEDILKEMICSVRYIDGVMAKTEPKAELIRCKDCKYFRTYYHGENMPFTHACDCMYLTNNLSVNDYCSRAVRK